jgi:hypothetical protein
MTGSGSILAGGLVVLQMLTISNVNDISPPAGLDILRPGMMLPKTIPYDQTLEITLDARDYELEKTIFVAHPNSDRIILRGAKPLTTKLLEVTSIGGFEGAYLVSAKVGSTDGMRVGDYIQVFNAAGLLPRDSIDYTAVLNGAWRLESIKDRSITFVVTVFHGPPATAQSMSAITALVRVYPTQLRWTGSQAGLTTDRIGGIRDLAVIGDSKAVPGIGILVRPQGSVQSGPVILGPRLLLANWRAAGVRVDSNGSVMAEGVVSSGNGQYGFEARDGGHLTCRNCVASGNGFLHSAISGVGDGFIAKNAASVLLIGGAAYGNWLAGFESSSASSLVLDATRPGVSVRNNEAAQCDAEAFLQAHRLVSLGDAKFGLYAVGCHLIAHEAVIEDSGSNAGVATNAGVLDVAGSTIVNAGANGLAATVRSIVLAPRVNIVSVRQLGFFVDDTSEIQHAGSIGLTSSQRRQ